MQHPLYSAKKLASQSFDPTTRPRVAGYKFDGGVPTPTLEACWGIKSRNRGTHPLPSGIHSPKGVGHSPIGGIHPLPSGIHSPKGAGHSPIGGIHPLPSGIHSPKGAGHSPIGGIHPLKGVNDARNELRRSLLQEMIK
jgi:hypothetical protein